MAMFVFQEIIDLIVMSAVLGVIFMDFFPKSKMKKLVYGDYVVEVPHSTYFDLESFKYAVIVAAPAVALHELGHKFVSLAFGLPAVFKAHYGGLIFGILVKFMFGWIFFIPGYVMHTPAPIPLIDSLIAFAGPLMNLLLYLGAHFAIKKGLWSKHNRVLYLTKEINKWLFFLNMLPIPPLDGSHVFRGIVRTIFG